MKSVFLVWMSCLYGFACLAQVHKKPPEGLIHEIIERFIENQESGIDYTDLYAQLEYYQQHPLNLNEATQEELTRLFFLSETQIHAIIRHREQYGQLISIYELQSIDALDERTIDNLIYFAAVDGNWQQDQRVFFVLAKQGKGKLFVLEDQQIQPSSGYSQARIAHGQSYYEGSPYRLAVRMKWQAGTRFSMGYNGEKDMGESLDHGFDFNSAHFFYKPNTKYWKTIALGDYQANFGQGLTFSSGITTHKSAYVLAVRRNSPALKPYQSLNENAFLRGLATQFQVKSFGITLFFSSKFISTTLASQDTISNDIKGFRAIQASGLHRTANEIAHKNNVHEHVLGGHFSYTYKGCIFGFTAVNTAYNKVFTPGDKPYQRYNFRGQQLTNLGFDYSFPMRNANVFGELAYSSNGACAFTTALSVPLHERLDLILLYRNYAKDYQAMYANPFAENSDGRNEQGIYTGIGFKLNRNWTLNSYLDFYHSDWMRYQINGASGGVDVLSELQYNPNKTIQLYLRYRHEAKLHNTDQTQMIQVGLGQVHKEQWRLHAQYKINEQLSGKSRCEIVNYTNPLGANQTGSLIYEDLSLSLFNKKLLIAGRVALFSVEDYNARVYAVESDVLYQYAVPMFQDKGIRYAVMLNYNITKRLECWIKFTQTTYSDLQSIGTGLDQIKGNKVSQFRLQMSYQF